MTSLTPRLLAWYNATHLWHEDPGDLAIMTGELLGRVGGQTLDFGVYDDAVTLPGLLVPEHYARESWKIHTVDPFPHFTESVRSQLLAKAVRNAEPRAGKIDHDVDGRAVGNWFRVGTNGYAGPNPPPSPPSGYWVGHLALVPDAYLPNHLLASLGDFGGEAKQFAIRGNGPDFAGVGADAGPVKYELVRWSYRDGDHPEAPAMGAPMRPVANLVAENGDHVEGTLLIQMLGPRSMKVESFPGKTATEVAGFDGAAQMYER